MALHKNLTGLDIHTAVTFTYADSTARLAATGFTSADINKIAIQQNDTSCWMLIDDSPITWKSLSGVDVFTSLIDTPSSYTGQGLNIVRVNAGETALEFSTPSPTTFLGLTDTPSTYTGNDEKIPIVDEGAGDLQFGYISDNNIDASANIAWTKIDKTGSNLTDMATRSHTDLSDIGTNTHAQIDTHLGSSSNPHTTTLEQARTANNQIAGNIDANNNTIVNLPNPSNGGDAANKTYVDAVASGISWLSPVIDQIDFTTSEPGSPTVGDRYINTVTGTSSGTAQSVTADHIYTWNGASWTDYSPSTSDACLVINTGDQVTYDGSDWIVISQGVVHNTLSGLQGGTSAQYYHLTSAEHTSVQTDIPLNNSHRASTSNPHTTTLEQARTAGATFAGAVDMGNYKITTLATPTASTDAATKGYVDGVVPSKTKIAYFKVGDYNTNIGNYRARSLATSGSYRFVFNIPYDFSTLTKIVMEGIPTGTNATADIDLTSDYAKLGEAYNFNTQSDTTSTYNIPTANAIYELDISTVFSSIEAGDTCGVFVDHSAIGMTINYLGIKIYYTSV